MRHKLFLTLLAAIAFTGTTFAQAGGGAAAAAAKGPEAVSGMGKDANYDQLQEHQRGGIAFNGKVVVENGVLPWDPIGVTVSCNGKPRYNTVADAKGRFTIQGKITTSEVVSTAADPKQPAASQLIGCDVTAQLSGFHSSVAHIANLNIMDNPDIGTIRLTADERASGTAVSATTSGVSKDALKHYEKARANWQDNHAGGAEHELQKAVQTDPKFAEAWYQLAKLQMKDKPQDALASLQKAAAADPLFVSPYEPIAEIEANQKNWQATADATAKSLKLAPEGSPQIWYYDAVGNYNLSNKDTAEASAEKSLAMDPQHIALNDEQLLAVILASKGDYQGAIQHLRSCLTYIPAGPNAELVKQQIAQLQGLVPAGK
jgi:tetratricopeptide (TPR) repeat protein